jgi:P-type Cu+ transporter
MGLLDKVLGRTPATTTATTKVTDPVCGMVIDPAKAAGTSTYQGKTVHFCSAGCKQRFEASPQQFASKMR